MEGSIKTIWRETFEEVIKWMKIFFKVVMKIGKWIFETLTKISKTIWEQMDKRFGEKD